MQLKDLKVEASIKDTEIFNRMIKVFLALMDDKWTPEWIKEKIQRLVLDELERNKSFVFFLEKR